VDHVSADEGIELEPGVCGSWTPDVLMGDGHNEAMLQLRWPQQP
jgi:hypothetical protein